MTMQAFHSNPAIKAKYLARVRAHRQADDLIQGTGWAGGKGCAVGCTLEAYDHSRYPIELGIPEQLAHLEDRLFELMSADQAMAWPERFIDAPRVGADLSGVFGQWAIWMLVDPTHGVIRHAGDRADERAAIERVADCWRCGATPEEFRAARAEAAEAARAAAWAAAWAAWAAEAAAAAAEAAAEAAEAAAAGAARIAWVTAASDELIRLMAAAPVVDGTKKDGGTGG